MALFQKKPKPPVVLQAPCKGKVIPTDEVTDYTFKNNLLGQGVAIIPEDGKVFAPMAGKISFVYPTLHVFGISNRDIDIIVHFGEDTGKMNGKGFTCHTETGKMVKQGDLLLEADLPFLEQQCNCTCFLLVTRIDEKQKFEPVLGETEAKAPILTISEVEE